ncbi:hypothetical protein [uncultured Cytophaga sp.]|uniref:hypothetical protein n=1 Tax=uncultured Cytophaga sp. TaxID=160238 RepID=UPI002634C2E9|nr:hypothetical protein [uncultured Cytophaga sp.]
MKSLFLQLIPTIVFISLHYNAVSANPIDSSVSRPLIINRACITSDAANTPPRKYIYDSDAYARLLAWSACRADSFPDVDFNKNVLIFVSYTYSGCIYNAERFMRCYVDHTTKKVILKIIVNQKGPCRPLYYAQDFFPIPIIPNDYSIEVRPPEKRAWYIIPAE